MPLTRDVLRQVTPQQAMTLQWVKFYSSQYFSLMSDGWLGWERTYIDTEAIARDFGPESSLRIARTPYPTLRINEDNNSRTPQDVTTKEQERGDRAEAADSTNLVEGEEEEEITEAEKIRSENSKRVAWYVTQQAFSRRR